MYQLLLFAIPTTSLMVSILATGANFKVYTFSLQKIHLQLIEPYA